MKTIVLICSLSAMLLGYSATASSATITLSTSATGRYTTFQTNTVYISVGQGQAGWQAFDISGLTGSVSSISYSFTLIGATNAHGFPLSMAVYDVTSDFTDLNVYRYPVDQTGLDVLLDLHSGNTYANFTANATNNEVYTMNFNEQAIADLNSSIGLGAQYFSIGIANINFDQLGYFTPYLATLTITTVPVPAAAWLFGSGLLGLIGVARHKKVV